MATLNVGDFLNWSSFVAIVAALPIGLICGLLPGVGGVTMMALMLPFIATLDPLTGLCFLLAAHSIGYTGGSVTAVLFGIPGEPVNAAIVQDGYALTQAGQPGRAIAIAVIASGAGGLVGFVFLIAVLPLMRLLLPLIGSPETFMLALTGLVCASRIGGNNVVKGLAAAAFGLFLGTVGYQDSSGVPRFWFGIDNLLDGISLVPMVTGLFAGPELVAHAGGKYRLQSMELTGIGRQMLTGARDVLKRPMLVLRSALVGACVGTVPGIGGVAAPFLTYAWLKRDTGDDKIAGHVEGVLIPESSANAKEGGNLVPTLALGIPSGASMAVLMAAFVVFGIDPGPGFMRDHAALVGGFAFALAASNVLGAIMMLALVPLLVRIVTVPPPYLVPIVFAFATLGAIAVHGRAEDLVVAVIFAGIGVVMQRTGYNRACLVLGMVLAPLLEKYFDISVGAFGPLFFLRPISLILAAVIVLVIVGPSLAGRLRGARP